LPLRRPRTAAADEQPLGARASHLLARFSPARDPAGAIYGTIITASTIVAAAEGVRHLWQIAATVAVTLLLYCIAHAYSRVLASSEGRVPSASAFAHELAVESTLLTACVLPLAVMVGAGLLGADDELAISIAVWLAVAMLFAWGLAAGRRVRSGAGVQLLSAAALGLIGVAIVALRILTGH